MCKWDVITPPPPSFSSSRSQEALRKMLFVLHRRHFNRLLQIKFLVPNLACILSHRIIIFINLFSIIIYALSSHSVTALDRMKADRLIDRQTNRERERETNKNSQPPVEGRSFPSLEPLPPLQCYQKVGEMVMGHFSLQWELPPHTGKKQNKNATCLCDQKVI